MKRKTTTTANFTEFLSNLKLIFFLHLFCSNEYQQSLFRYKSRANNVYPCQIKCYTKVTWRGSEIYGQVTEVSIMEKEKFSV